MVAFALSFLVTIGMFVGFVLYGRRRPVGAPLSWGEANAAATFAFFGMFLAYGVVPHQWLTYANNELFWTPAKLLIGWHTPFTGDEGLAEFLLPFQMNWEVISHMIVTVIYVVFLAMHVWAWAIWQDRAKKKPTVAVSEYGRPLVKQGSAG